MSISKFGPFVWMLAVYTGAQGLTSGDATAATTAPTLKFSASTLSFANQQAVTPSPPKTLTVTNPGTTAVAVNAVAVIGGQADDFSQTNTCGASIAAKASCNIRVIFAPVSTGNKSATLSVTDGAAGSPQRVTLTGTGVVPVFGVNATKLTVTVAPDGPLPMPTVGLTVTNPDSAGLFYSATVSGTAVLRASLQMSTTPVNAVLSGSAQLALENPGQQGSGTFVSTVIVNACRDAACTKPLAGSPQKVTVTYVVTGNAIPDGLFSQSPTLLNLETPSSAAARTTIINLIGYSLPPYPLHVTYTRNSTTLIPSMSFSGFPVTGGYGAGKLTVNFAAPSQLGPGVYTDTITLSACYDAACKKPAIGSPWVIPVTYTVTASLGREFTQRIVPLSAEAIAADPAGTFLYLADWEAAQATPGHLIKVNPTTGSQLASVAIDDYPRRVVISPDGKYAYVVIALSLTDTAEIERVNLATMAVDLRIPLPLFGTLVGDLAVSPLNSTTLAVSYSYFDRTLGNLVVVQIFDGAKARPKTLTSNPALALPISIQWRADGAQLYLQATNALNVSAVQADGLAPATTLVAATASNGLTGSFTELAGLLYCDGGGVLNPATRAVLGRYVFRTPATQPGAPSPAVDLYPDATTQTTFAAYDDPSDAANAPTLQSFALATFKPVWVARFPTAISSPVRWGTDGLAFIAQDLRPQHGHGMVYVIQGSFVKH